MKDKKVAIDASCACAFLKNCHLRSAYTGRLPANLSHATRMNMGKSSVIV